MINLKRLRLGLVFALVVVRVSGQDASESDPELKLSGTLRADFGYFESSRNPNRMPNNTFVIAGNPRLTYGEWDIPIDFQVGNYANRLTQPFNKIGASPSYKWAKLHLGYRQLSFSPFTYHNHLLLGGGIELTPGKLRLTALYGELKRASAGGLFDDDTRFAPPAFRRMAVLTKLGFGSEERFVDFIFIKGWDEESQASMVKDSLGVYPEENVVLGIHIDQTIAEKLNITISGALSAYTQDTRSPLVDTEPYFGQNIVDGIFEPKISSQYLTAFLASAEYRSSLWQLNGEYRMVQPGFQSMGAYFNQSDIQRVGFGGNARLLDKRLRVNANWRQENNNVFDTKLSENKRQFINAQAEWTQKRSWTASLNGSFFSSKQNSTVDSLSGLFDFQQNTLQGTARFNKLRTTGENHYSIQLLAMQRRDLVFDQTPYSNLTFRGSYTVPLGKKNLWSVVPELGVSRFVIIETITTWRINPGARLNYRSKNKKFSGNFSAFPNFEIADARDDQLVWRTSLSMAYQLKKRHRFSLRADHTVSSGGYSYSEFRARVGYNYRF